MGGSIADAGGSHLREGTELLRHQLHAAEQRAAQLEEQLIVALAPSGPSVSNPNLPLCPPAQETGQGASRLSGASKLEPVDSMSSIE